MLGAYLLTLLKDGNVDVIRRDLFRLGLLRGRT